MLPLSTVPKVETLAFLNLLGMTLKISEFSALLCNPKVIAIFVSLWSSEENNVGSEFQGISVAPTCVCSKNLYVLMPR